MDTASPFDAIGRRILRALQADGRMTYDDLAAQVGLSASAVLRRVKRKEDGDVIADCVALVATGRVGLGLRAYLNVRLENHTASHKRSPMDAATAAAQTWPEVTECAALTGERGYLRRVLVQDMAHYSRFFMAHLLKLPSGQDCKTSFVLQ